MKIDEKLLNDCMDKIVGKKHVYSTVMRVESGDGSFEWSGARGDMQADSPFFIASVTKMYVSAVITQLAMEQKLQLNDKIATYLSQTIMADLHVYKGKDYSGELTVQHLLANTSGLPDYFFGKENGKPAADSLTSGHDEAWGLERSVECIKKLKPKFASGGGVFYSDVNFQLLGKIIENVTEQEIGTVFARRIFEPLDLRNTYLYQNPDDTRPVPFYHGDRQLWLPVYMASIGAEGGIVSTAREVNTFAKAFFTGRLFPKECIDNMKHWRLMLPPPGLFYFGVGLERQPAPRFISPRKPLGEILGFWGQTSAYTWYHPNTDLYFSGTANQSNASGHSAVMNSIVKMIKSVL